MNRMRCFSILLIAVMMLTAVGCTDSSAPGISSQSSSQGGSEEERDTIKIAIQRDVTALDGFTGNNVSYGIAYQILDTLVALNDDMSIRPNLATSWEQVDDYTWRFTLREGVTFSNGEAFNAESAAYSVNYMASLDSGYQNWKQWGQSWPPEATAESEYSLLIKTAAPNLTVPVMMTRGAMLPIEGSQEEGYFSFPYGTGPYNLVSWDAGIQIVLEANEDYWGEQPQIKTLIYDIITDSSARVAALKGGEYDFIADVPFDQAVSMMGNNDTGMELVRTDSTGMWYLFINGNSENPFIQNPEFRKAMLYAIDHKGIIDSIMAGMVNGAQSITPMYIDGVYDGGGYPERDIEAAKAMAEACGYNGEEIIYAYTQAQFNNDIEVVELVISQLQEAGFNILYTEVDSASWSSIRQGSSYDISSNGYGGTYTGDSEQYYTQGLKNINWEFPEVEALLEEIYGEGITEERRSEALSEMMEICWNAYPYLWAAEACGLWAVNPSLKGYEIFAHNQVNFSSAYLG